MVSLDDEQKEQQVRKLALRMFKNTTLFLLKFLFICVALYGLYRLAISSFAIPERQIVDALVSPASIFALTLSATSYGWIRRVVVERL